MVERLDAHRREQRQLQWVVARPVEAMTVLLAFGLAAIGWEIRQVSRRAPDNSSILECLIDLTGQLDAIDNHLGTLSNQLNHVSDDLGKLEDQVADLAYEIKGLAARVDGENYVGLRPFSGTVGGGQSDHLPVSVRPAASSSFHPCG
jgi:hypothetical protein